MAKKIPDFESEAEEKAFWKTHHPLDYVNWNQAESVVSKYFGDKKTRKDIFEGFSKKERKK